MMNSPFNMYTDLLLQAVLILVTIFMFLLMHNIPKKLLSKYRYRNTAASQSKRHFVLGAQLLSKARSTTTRSARTSIANQAILEAEKAIELDPRDAASHILKALALEVQGHRSSAVDSLDVALSPLAVKSLSDEEIGDALFKRAELKLGLSKRGRVDSAIDDLCRSVNLLKGKGSNGKVYCLLGECYEIKEMRDEARRAYEDAIKVQPELTLAREKLDRLRS